MGSFSLLHWIIVLFIVGVPVAAVAAIVWLVARTSNRRTASAATSGTASSLPSVESRLQQLDALKDKGLISESEYQQQRATILRSV